MKRLPITPILYWAFVAAWFAALLGGCVTPAPAACKPANDDVAGVVTDTMKACTAGRYPLPRAYSKPTCYALAESACRVGNEEARP